MFQELLFYLICSDSFSQVLKTFSYQCFSEDIAYLNLFFNAVDRCDQCGANAECVSDLATGQYICRCPYGFYGDGLRCERYDCREANVCDINAECQFDTNMNLFLCRCKSGFAGEYVQNMFTCIFICSLCENEDICACLPVCGCFREFVCRLF